MVVATVFGMNLATGVEHSHPMLFWVVFAVGILAGMVTKGWVTKGVSPAATETRDSNTSTATRLDRPPVT